VHTYIYMGEYSYVYKYMCTYRKKILNYSKISKVVLFRSLTAMYLTLIVNKYQPSPMPKLRMQVQQFKS
jgi:hypothetical protein